MAKFEVTKVFLVLFFPWWLTNLYNTCPVELFMDQFSVKKWKNYKFIRNLSEKLFEFWELFRGFSAKTLWQRCQTVIYMSRVQFWKKFYSEESIQLETFFGFPEKNTGMSKQHSTYPEDQFWKILFFSFAMAKLTLNSDSRAVQKLQTDKNFGKTLDFQYLFAKKPSKFSVSESMRKYMIDFSSPVVVLKKKENKLKTWVQRSDKCRNRILLF